MKKKQTNKSKIFNDPVNGFISISDDLIFDLIEHPYFQRLRRISQTALTNYVYPGATHTRFHHALGAMHLMQMSINVLRDKKVKISKEEENATLIAILLHDIGHGPFSHALESALVEGLHHEKLSLILMNSLNQEFKGKLSLAIDIFLNKYPRNFFHQLISSEIDVDRLDYLKRDSFYTGVSEGNINSERIITMLNVHNDELVIDSKGIYSIEKYLTSRVFMYWQVYFHKTSVTVETYLIQALKRAKELSKERVIFDVSENLQYFLNRIKSSEITESDINKFTELDDTDIIFALKNWQYNNDKILSLLSSSIIQRKLPMSLIIPKPINIEDINDWKKQVEQLYKIEKGDYFVHQNKLEVLGYNKNESIKLLYKKGLIVNLQESDNQNLINSLAQKTIRYHICIPRDVNTFF